MATEPTAPKGQTTASNHLFAPSVSTDWLKFWSDAPARFYTEEWRKILGLAADRLRDQADFLRNVSQCTDPAEALKLNANFAQQSLALFWENGSKAFDSFRAPKASNAVEK